MAAICSSAPSRNAPEPTAGSSTVTREIASRTRESGWSRSAGSLLLPHPEPARNPRCKCGANHGADQLRWSEEGARFAALVRRHQSLEHATQHVRRDATAIALGERELEPLEELVERVAPDERAAFRPPAPLERVGLEQPAVEEWKPPEAPRCGAPTSLGLVQRAEEQGSQQVALDLAPPGQHAVDLLAQKMRLAVEPAFGLHEIEEKHPSELQQRELVPLIGWNPGGKGAAHPLEGTAEGREKAASHRLGVEGARDVRGGTYRALAAATGQSLERAKRQRSRAVQARDQHRPWCQAHGNSQNPRPRLERQHGSHSSSALEPPRHACRYTAGALVGFKRQPLESVATADDCRAREPGAIGPTFRGQPLQRWLMPGRPNQGDQVLQPANPLQQRDQRDPTSETGTTLGCRVRRVVTGTTQAG